MSEAVLSMDVEDWRHLDYIDRSAADPSYSMLDGVERYAELLAEHGLRTTFFVLGELAQPLAGALRQLHASGHEIASHGWSHKRPLRLTIGEFREELRASRRALEDAVGARVHGYRAPCFSLDRERLDAVRECGYSYDSSRIDFSAHPLYGTLDMEGFDEVRPGVFLCQDFGEFQVATADILGRQFPISGGGYLRIFPWPAMRTAIRRYLRRRSHYGFYIHPFELSQQPNPPFPAGTRQRDQWRCKLGRSSTPRKVEKLIRLLRSEQYTITTYRGVWEQVLAANPDATARHAA